jgi:hypothetical protein
MTIAHDSDAANAPATRESTPLPIATDPARKRNSKRRDLTNARQIANAFGVVDHDSMRGLLRQLVKASLGGHKADQTTLAFMMSMVRNIGPRDSIEAMLVVQMVCLHVMAMRCAHGMATAEDVVQRDSATRAFARLARTFPAQMEALNRHRGGVAGAMTVQDLTLHDGAGLGGIAQQARLFAEPPPTSTEAGRA